MERYIKKDTNDIVTKTVVGEDDNYTKVADDKVVVKLTKDLGFGEFKDSKGKYWMFGYTKDGTEYIGCADDNGTYTYYVVEERLDRKNGSPKWVVLDSTEYDDVESDSNNLVVKKRN